MKRCRENGLGLMEVLVAAAIGTVVIAAVTTGLQNSNRFSQKVASSVDLSALKAQITASVDCAKTMQGRTMGSPCSSAGEYIAIRTEANDVFIKQDGTTTVGNWNLLARCRTCAPGAANCKSGLEIRAAKIAGGGSAARNFLATNENWFKVDEMNRNLRYDWNHPKGKLFEAQGVSGLCGHWWGGGSLTADCTGPNEYVKSIDWVRKEAQCGVWPQCPNGQFFRGIKPNGLPDCVIQYVGHVSGSNGALLRGSDGVSANRVGKGRYTVFFPKLPGHNYAVTVTPSNTNGDHLCNTREEENYRFKVWCIDTGLSGGAGNDRKDDTSFSFSLVF